MVSSHECEMMWVALYFKPYDNETCMFECRHPILWSLAVSPSTCRTWGTIWHNGMRTRRLCGGVWASTLLGNQGAHSHMFLSVLFSARIFKHGRQHTQMLECRHRFLRAGICMPGCGHRFPRAGIQILECGKHFLRAGICMPICGHRSAGAGIQMLECGHRCLRAGICMPRCGHRSPRAGIQMLECEHRFLRAGICMPGCGHRFPRAGIQMLECGHRAGHFLLIICNAGTHTPFGVYINISQKGWGGEGGE